MPNGQEPKEYGPHKYNKQERPSHCEYGCGCWTESFRSGGPLGLDPFGTCPNNPTDGKLLGEDKDYEYVVNKRIEDLTLRAYNAEGRLKAVSPSQKKLARKLAILQEKLGKKELVIRQFRKILRKNR